MVNKMNKTEQKKDFDNFAKELRAVFKKYGIKEAIVPQSDDCAYLDNGISSESYLPFLELDNGNRWDKLSTEDICGKGLGDFSLSLIDHGLIYD